MEHCLFHIQTAANKIFMHTSAKCPEQSVIKMTCLFFNHFRIILSTVLDWDFAIK